MAHLDGDRDAHHAPHVEVDVVRVEVVRDVALFAQHVVVVVNVL